MDPASLQESDSAVNLAENQPELEENLPEDEEQLKEIVDDIANSLELETTQTNGQPC